MPSPPLWRAGVCTFKDKPYEYVMVDTQSLAAVSADGSAFADYIASGEGKWRLRLLRGIYQLQEVSFLCRPHFGDDRLVV